MTASPRRSTGLLGRHAADFTLPEVQSGQPISFHPHLGQPMVLIFGSYDCNLFCKEAPQIERLYQAYKSRVQLPMTVGVIRSNSMTGSDISMILNTTSVNSSHALHI
jgi:hypothetical protein